MTAKPANPHHTYATTHRGQALGSDRKLRALSSDMVAAILQRLDSVLIELLQRRKKLILCDLTAGCDSL